LIALLVLASLIPSTVARACSLRAPPRGEQYGGWIVEYRPGFGWALTYSELSLRTASPYFRQVGIGPRSLSFFALGAHPNATLRIAGAAPISLSCRVSAPFATCGASTSCALPPAQLDSVLQELLRSDSAVIVHGQGIAFALDLSHFREAWAAYARSREGGSP
jgi:hypothetical protein